MGSGLIYIIIVGMWIAYFLPRWIASHEEVSGRSIEKFALTMKVVGRTAGSPTFEIEEIKRRHAGQVTTRRILFTSILSITFLVAVFTIIGLLSPAIMLLPISGFILFVVHARHQIAANKEEMARVINTSPARREDKYRELITRSRRIAQTRIDISEEQWTPLSERIARSENDSHGITIIERGTQNTWSPIEVPAPSYMNSSFSSRKVRRITKLLWVVPSPNTAAVESMATLPRCDATMDRTQANDASCRARAPPRRNHRRVPRCSANALVCGGRRTEGKGSKRAAYRHLSSSTPTHG